MRALQYSVLAIVYLLMVGKFVFGPPIWHITKTVDAGYSADSPVCTDQFIKPWGFPYQVNDSGTCDPPREINNNNLALTTDALFLGVITGIFVYTIYLLRRKEKEK